ncbi:MAG TPA: hypothetical protein VG267_10880 [Terracidiphilus sp.]|nr:hypothetical protein [Terracidiphilus sp.]
MLDTAPIDTLGFAPIAMLPTAPIAMLDVVPVTMPDAASCAGNRSSRANVRRQDRILSICDYETQRRSREILLKGQGFHVESFASSDVLDALFVRGSQIAILCYSVAQARAVRLADTLHRYHPHICVVRLQRMERSTDPCFDQEIDSQAGSDQLVRVIRQVASRLSGANQSPW